MNLRKYCPLLKRMYLTCCAWVESLKTREDGRRGNIKILSKTRVSITVSCSFLTNTCRYFFGVSFIQSLKTILRTALTQRK